MFKNIPYGANEGKTNFFFDQNHFSPVQGYWIRILIANADPDQGEQNQCGSMHSGP
jgi:hypothetical protein